MSTLTIETRKRSADLRAEFADAEQEWLKADKQREAARNRLRKNLADYIEMLRAMCAEMKELLRQGGEKRCLIDTIDLFIPLAQEVVATLSATPRAFEDPPTLATIDSYIQEAKDSVAWMRQLAQQAAKPAPPLDESKLPPPPTGPQGAVEGFVSIAEARTRRSR